eukprot:TRINITY_DN8657_c0_g1_i1.p1 TRINITY_DN8657_c0_g1~~TRINITY_DN8657_c0_g1_i1.p1  ORF type:complete len:180 (-),score=32.47 TRINITY_DN8657_c0_g1_i1:82-621(-)
MSLYENIENSTQAQDKWWEVCSTFTDVFMITNSTEGKQHGRPMHIISVEKNVGIFFFTSKNSPKVQEVKNDDTITITGQQSSRWIYTTGKARIITDQAKIKELWTEGVRPWFPQGTQDSEVSLIQMIPEIGEYWDNSSLTNKLYYVYELAKGYITNQKADMSGSDWARVEMLNTQTGAQ